MYRGNSAALLAHYASEYQEQYCCSILLKVWTVVTLLGQISRRPLSSPTRLSRPCAT